MKHNFITIALALLLGHGCRTTKERSEAAQRHLAIENKQGTILWIHYDSTGRHWQFQSDSPFYYNADIGLYGRGGRLTVGEEHIQRNRWQSQDDSIGYRLEEQSQQTYRSESAPYRDVWCYVAGFGFILVALAAYRKWTARR